MRKLHVRVMLGLCLASCASLYAGGMDNEMDEPEVIAAGEKKPCEIRGGDAGLTFGGKTVTEHRFTKNAVMLNSDLPDETGHFRQTLDMKTNFAWGEKKFDHKAVELGSVLRFKTIWGKID